MQVVEVLEPNTRLLHVNISNNACAFKTAKALGCLLSNNG